MAAWWRRIVSRNVVTVSRRAATENRSSGRSSVGTATHYGRVRHVWSNGRAVASLLVLFVPTNNVLESASESTSRQ